MARTIHRLLLTLVFPSGISPGEGKSANHLAIACDGQNRPVLRGTALAGALRHAYARLKDIRHKDAARWFGQALDGHTGQPSPLLVPDSRLEIDKGTLSQRTHNAHDRHTGAVLGKGLFSLEALPPGTRTTICLWLEHDSADDATALAFFTDLVGILRAGLTLGGHAARGVGRVELASGKALYASYACADLEQHATCLDEQAAWRAGRAISGGRDLTSTPIANDVLRIDLVLTVPPGEDLLVGDGQGFDHQLEPQQVVKADGTSHWRLPGSSLRGVFRGWMTRLAARAGQPIADSAKRRRERAAAHSELDGDDLAWGFSSPEDIRRIQKTLAEQPNQAQVKHVIPCPIMRLFGSSFAKGRIHISDALSETPIQKSDYRGQSRAHVAVDRVTGGANEGFFFRTAVLADRVRFPVTITIQNPTSDEARWLLATLRALDVGVLRVGSSKAGGRLALAAPPRAEGAQCALFADLKPSGV